MWEAGITIKGLSVDKRNFDALLSSDIDATLSDENDTEFVFHSDFGDILIKLVE